MGYSIIGRHYITINGEMISQSISQATTNPIFKTKGKVTLPPMSVSVVEIKMPMVPNTNNPYKLNFDMFQVPEGVIPLDVIHGMDHKNPKTLNIPIMNTNNISCSLTKNLPIGTLALAGRCEEVQDVNWTKLQDNTARLLPKIPNNTNLQLEPDTNHLSRSIPDVDIPDEARDRLKELLGIKYADIMSQTAMDIGRTNLIELDILTEGPPIALKPYTVPLKYCEFVDHEIKHLKEVRIISRSMNDWASPILVVPKKEEK